MTSGIMLAADQSEVTLLALLDLLQRLFTTIGINGAAHGWITSFLTNRTQQVVRGRKICARSADIRGSQGSVLGPLLFVLYIAELSAIIKKRPNTTLLGGQYSK